MLPRWGETQGPFSPVLQLGQGAGRQGQLSHLPQSGGRGYLSLTHATIGQMRGKTRSHMLTFSGLTCPPLPLHPPNPINNVSSTTAQEKYRAHCPKCCSW